MRGKVFGSLAGLVALGVACSGGDATISDASSDGTVGDAPASDSPAFDSSTDGGPQDAAVPFDGAHPNCAQSPNKTGTTQRTAAGNPYVAFVPSTYDPLVASTLVVGLHGAGDTAGNFLAVLWQANAQQRGFIVIAPEGTAPLSPGYTWNTSDDTLILAAIDDVQKCYTIDPKRIIIHGFSAGGIMSYWIGLGHANVFSSVTINSADLGSAEAINGGSLLPSPWLIPVSHTHGTQDQNFPIANALAGITQL